MTNGGHHHPWRAFRELVHIRLRWADLGDGLLGVTDFDAGVITLTTGMTQVERRCTIAHEAEHVRRGPAPAHLKAREDQIVDHIVARRLVDFDRLVEAMLWCRDDIELADELWVDVATVRARLSGLSSAESIELNRRLDEAELHIP